MYFKISMLRNTVLKIQSEFRIARSNVSEREKERTAKTDMFTCCMFTKRNKTFANI